MSDEDLVLALRTFEFRVVSHYEYYTAETVPDPQKVLDEDIIPECAQKGWVLLTADQDMEYRHFAVIKKHEIAIFTVPDNRQKPTRWAEGLVKGRPHIYRAVRNYRLPFVGRLNSSGQLYQLRCISPTDNLPSDCALLIKAGKTDHNCAKRHRQKAG